MFGAKARELVFLRSHGHSRRQRTPQVRDRAAEVRVTHRAISGRRFARHSSGLRRNTA
jgi:hypothetical protein